MPTLSIFFGIIIRMYFRDHAPPHFHAEYAGQEVQINIQTLEVLKGSISRRALGLVLDWAELHQQELLEAWEKASNRQTPSKIAPLE
jgi:hypothetical protein